PQQHLQREGAEHGAQADGPAIAGQRQRDQQETCHPSHSPEQVDHRSHLTATSRKHGAVVRASVGVRAERCDRRAPPTRDDVGSSPGTGWPRPGAETTPAEPDRVRTRGGMLQMNAAPTTTLFERLTAAARTEWEGYTHHSFVEQLGEGTLP